MDSSIRRSGNAGCKQEELEERMDVGIQPCCRRQDFLGWLEKWLDQGDGADYFEEYPYE